MFRNYFKIAIRNLLKNKTFSIINILGLSLGLTVCLLIAVYVAYELSYDKFNGNYKTLYRVAQHQDQNGIWYKVGRTPIKLAPTLKTEFPEVENATRFAMWGNVLLSNENKSIDEPSAIYAESALFEMFSFPFINGNAQQALANPNSIVLTETTAKKYFGNANPIGKTLIINKEHLLKVTGVIHDLPAQSHLQFDFVIPFEFIKNYGTDFDDWGGNGYYTYVQLKDAAKQSVIDSKLSIYSKKTLGRDGMKLYLQPLSDIHLKSAFDFNTDFGERGDIRYVRFFIILALVILLLGCLNFMNLSTARALKRAKEVGLRKTIGARRGHLVAQFLGESFLIVTIAGVLALGFVKIAMPTFSNFIEKPIIFQFNNLQFWAIFSSTILITSLFAGSYPAFVLSSYRPIKVLRGQSVATNSGINLRKALVVIQFTLAIVMSVAVLVIYQQLHFVSNKKLGINKKNIVYVEMKGGLQKNYNVVKEALLKYPSIESVTATNFYSMPFKWVGSGGIRRLRIDGQSPNKEFNISAFDADFDFVETMGIEIVEGRSFSKNFASDTVNYILNEEAVRQLEIKNPIGKTFDWGVKGTIVGVVKDFHFSKLKDKIEPAIIKVRPAETNYLLVRVNSDNISNNIRIITKLSNQYSEGFPVETHFLEADYDQLYQQERTTETLFGGFTALAIFISCLGLFGLVTHTAETRTKEIGIRKVLGASVMQIITILSQDFIKLLLIAIIIATPLAWWGTSRWLENFAYRIDLSLWMFLIVSALTILAALLTISFQAIRTAVANPVKSLRSE